MWIILREQPLAIFLHGTFYKRISYYETFLLHLAHHLIGWVGAASHRPQCDAPSVYMSRFLENVDRRPMEAEAKSHTPIDEY